MTHAEKIRLLVIPINDWTDAEADYVIANRDEFKKLAKTEDYYKADDAEQKARMEAGKIHYQGVSDHIKHKGGQLKTVCASTVLGHFGVHPDSYHYCGHSKQDNAILRRNGWSVRSRKSALKLKVGKSTVAEIRLAIKERGESGKYRVSITDLELEAAGERPHHVFVMNASGETVVDTDDTKESSVVRAVHLVTRK